jgi:hypothetical protein
VRRALYAEWSKLRTTTGPAWLTLSAILLTVAVGVVTTASVNATDSPGQDPVKLGLVGVDLGQSLIACLAVLMVSGEYATGMILTTLTAIPRRLTVLAAKATLLTAATVVAGSLAVLASVLTARLLLPGNGFTPAHGYQLVSLDDGLTLRAVAGTVLYLALVALLSLGIATAVRDAGTAIGVILGLLYLFPLLTALVGDARLHRHLEQIGPMTAGLAIQATTHAHAQPIGPWAGLGVLAIWAASALLVGAALLQLRDA